MFTTTTLYADIPDFLKVLIKPRILQAGSGSRKGDAFKLEYQKPSKCEATNKPIVYFHRIEVNDLAMETLCENRKEVAFRLGIIRKCGTKPALYDEMLGILLEMFSEHNCNAFEHTFTFKGTDYTGKTLGQLGIDRVRRTDILELEDECDQIMHEFRVRLQLRFETKKINLN